MPAEEKKEMVHPNVECPRLIQPVRDALEVLEGKWKLPILISLSFGPKRFKQISEDVHGITDKVLSKELKMLEVNKLVQRTVFATFPPRVEYNLTDHGKTLRKVIEELRDWGVKHRRKIMGK